MKNSADFEVAIAVAAKDVQTTRDQLQATGRSLAAAIQDDNPAWEVFYDTTPNGGQRITIVDRAAAKRADEWMKTHNPT